ncbi:MAG TPA: hypothetical protein VFV71_01685 [Burkholderiales bacterium]|nr:hypothetical protein [Burkholderiales bacterium]
MKKTLYEILGVDAKASKEEIEAAYAARVDELKSATLQDPNKLRMLQSSREILADANRRAAYDASLARPETRPKPAAAAPKLAPADSEPGLLQQWGKWVALAVAVVAVIAWWAPGREPRPPAPAPAVPQPGTVVPPPAATQAPAAAPPAAPASAETPAAPAAPAVDASAAPLLGDWNCTDAISGRTGRYSFREDGVLAVASTDGQAEYRFELAGRTLTLTTADRVSTLTAEELGARKMILNTGSEGRRLVCKR